MKQQAKATSRNSRIRMVVLLAAAALAVAALPSTAFGELPEHGHVMLVGVEVEPGSFPPRSELAALNAFWQRTEEKVQRQPAGASPDRRSPRPDCRLLPVRYADAILCRWPLLKSGAGQFGAFAV
jgi:hypothetical protein